MREEIVVGGVYRHFKGGEYEVMCVAEGVRNKSEKGMSYRLFMMARDCENSRNAYEVWEQIPGNIFFVNERKGRYVVYKQLYRSENFSIGTVWMRSLEDFCGKKVLGDGAVVDRFERVN
jgi:hypothetical protein